MTVSLISNTASRIARSSLDDASVRMNRTMTRMTSGQRVFSASEDAAAMAVSTSLKVNAASLKQAVLNTSTGSSMLQVAEGALQALGDITQRMKALASQASSGQLDNTARGLLDVEYQSLKTEMGRIVADTDFNGENLLAGDALFDVDYAHSIQGVGFSDVEVDSTVVTADAVFRLTYDSLEEELTLKRLDTAGAASQTIDITALLDNIAGVGQNLTAGESVEVSFGGIGVTLKLDDAFDRTTNMFGTVDSSATGSSTFNFAAAVAPAVVAQPLTFSATGLSTEAIDALIVLDASAYYDVSNGLVDIPVNSNGVNVTLGGLTGLRYSVNGGAVGGDGIASGNLASGAAGYFEVYVTTASGYEKLARLDMTSVTTSGSTAGTLRMPLGKGLFDADMTAGAGNVSFEYMVGRGANVNEDFMNVTLTPMTVNALGLTTSNIRSVTAAETALTDMANALESVNGLRANIGAYQARLEFISLNLNNAVENTLAANSALIDNDITADMTALANDQALVEVGVGMLSRVNQNPQRLLRLLEG
ncbi:MAG: flagellin [Alphaproteobacteria bacterium]